MQKAFNDKGHYFCMTPVKVFRGHVLVLTIFSIQELKSKIYFMKQMQAHESLQESL